MPHAPSIYDLMLLLATGTEDDARAKIVADVESAISAGGGIVERKDHWGVRALTFQIDHQADADYHLVQFSGPAPLLESLSHSLRINDGVLRFRIIKVIPGTPPPPDAAPPVPAAPVAPTPAMPAPVPVSVAAEPDE